MSARADDLRLVVFDLGQVLIRVCDGWRDACTRVGIAHGDSEPDPQTAARMTEIVHRWDSGLIDLAQFAREIGPLRNISAEDVIRIHDAYLLGPFDGAAKLIDELNASGLKTACLSNTNAGHWQLMNARGGPNFLPLDRMTYRFASHLIGCCKPDERIYRHVEEQTGVRGREIMFFDDRGENVDAAQRRGWRGHVIEIGADPIAQVRRHLAR